MQVIPDPAPEIRAILKDLTSVIINPSWSSPTHVFTALIFAVNVFCNATGTPHDEFCENLLSLRDGMKKKPCA